MNTIENNPTDDLKSPNEEKFTPELDRLDKVYSGTVKSKLEALRKMHFTGTSEEEGTEKENEATCTVKMTSQYQAVEVTLNPNALLKIFQDAQINTAAIEIDQLAHVCVALGESARLAYNNAKDKTHKGSETVFNHLMEEMQKELFDTKE